MESAELFLQEGHPFACSRICWSVNLADLPRSHGVFVPGADVVPAGPSKELALPFMSPLKKSSLIFPFRSLKIFPPALVDKITDLLEVLTTMGATPPPVFEILDLEKTEYTADVLNFDYPAQVVYLTDPDHVEILRNMVR